MRFNNSIVFLLGIFLVTSACQPSVDLVVHNAKVYTVNDNLDEVQAFAVKEGKFIEVGGNEILQKYEARNIVDAQGLPIYPGLIDSHSHFLQLGLSLKQANLEGTTSFKEVVERVTVHAKSKEMDVIYGSGWDQNDWEDPKYPKKDTLDLLFPNTPVVLKRIDGHAYLVNQKALDLASITATTELAGGTVVLVNGEPTGVLIDSPMNLVNKALPPFTQEEKIEALAAAEEVCLKNGLTTVTDAGLDRQDIELIDNLHQKNQLQIRVYAMVKNTFENLEYYLSSGIYSTDKINVRSIKIYADGALGSRGAALLTPYIDQPGHKGKMITPIDSLKSLANRIGSTDFQMNTHAIGDAANAAVLKVYNQVLKNKNDPRWRIEHAQVVAPSDFEKFNNKIIPSVQPLHATSDMYWAKDRLGSKRMKYAYAFKQLLDNAGRLALGTDFPVETVNPFHTFYAAVSRKDLAGYPEKGFQIENKISRYEALLGMTRWAAQANFEEDYKGSIEVGKQADFVILDRDIMQIFEKKIPKTRVIATLIDGKIVYSNRF